MHLQKAQKKDSHKQEVAPFGNRKDPEHEHISKMKKVLVIESDPQMMILIEDQLKKSCDLKAYKCLSSVEMALELVNDKMDVVVIGPLFKDGRDELGRLIKSKFPTIKVIKLAGTSEYKRITGEVPCVGKTKSYDHILQFSQISELKGIIEGKKD